MDKDKRQIKIIVTDANNPDFHKLSDMLDEAFMKMIPLENRTCPTKYAFFDLIGKAVVLYENDVPAACVAYKKKCSVKGGVELTRMFVRPEYRHNNYGEMVLKEIERHLTSQGYEKMVTESSPESETAIKMNERNGFVHIPPYPPYTDPKKSICMMKILGKLGNSR
jgi:GNAT superfamily N-acetyltransferase